MIRREQWPFSATATMGESHGILDERGDEGEAMREMATAMREVMRGRLRAGG